MIDLRLTSINCPGEPQYYYRGTETFLSLELLESRRQLLLKQKILTAVNPHSADVYANGVMLTILLRSALRQVRLPHRIHNYSNFALNK